MASHHRDPGALNVRLGLEEATASPDGQGGETVTWLPLAPVWAAVEPVRASPHEQGGAEASTLVYRVTIRRGGDVSRGMRFRFGTRLLAIRTLRDADGSGRYLLCECEELD